MYQTVSDYRTDIVFPFHRHSLDQVVKELKQILKRDFNKRMIENTAYKLFEKWWDEQAEQHKVTRTESLHYSYGGHILHVSYCIALSL